MNEAGAIISIGMTFSAILTVSIIVYERVKNMPKQKILQVPKVHETVNEGGESRKIKEFNDYLEL